MKKKKIGISVGIMAYNEEQNVAHLLNALLRQNMHFFTIQEIIIVSSGSTDRTNQIAGSFAKRYKKIKLLTQRKREGKWSAINVFLKNAKNQILVLASADIIPKDDAVEKLCMPLLSKNIGIVGSHPIPVNSKDSLMGRIIHIQWKLHHLLSLKKPKFGEMIAFLNIIPPIGPTAVDEEFIAMHMQRQGYRGVYASDALVLMKGPGTMREFIRQKRRIHAGHMNLKKKHGYRAASLSKAEQISLLTFSLVWQNFFPLATGAVLDGLARVIARIDLIINRDHAVWKISPSTKTFLSSKKI